MSLVKYNNNSISSITTAGQLASGSLVPISEQTASGSASIEFTTGIDSTYPIYKFEFINIHPSVDNHIFEFQGNVSGGSGYNEIITSTSWRAYHSEADTTFFQYTINDDLAQGTDFQHLANGVGNANDESLSGELYLFNPSSTTFVKHFIVRCIFYEASNVAVDHYTAGYFNTTSAIDEIQFKMASGNIDAGTIKLYGIKDS